MSSYYKKKIFRTESIDLLARLQGIRSNLIKCVALSVYACESFEIFNTIHVLRFFM